MGLKDELAYLIHILISFPCTPTFLCFYYTPSYLSGISSAITTVFFGKNIFTFKTICVLSLFIFIIVNSWK